MKWANKSLEELEEIYWDQIAPEFRNDGYDPTTEYPSYQWLVEHGYRGFRYPFSGQSNPHDLTLARFFNEHLGLSSPTGSTFEWRGNHQETHHQLNQFLETVAQSGVDQGTVEKYQYRLSTLLRLYQEIHNHVDIINVAEEGIVSLRHHWKPVLSDLDRELGSQGSKQKYIRTLISFYDFLFGDANNPFTTIIAEVEWSDDDTSNPKNLGVSQIAEIYNITTSLEEQLVVLLTAGCGLSTKACATLQTDQVQCGCSNGEAVFFVEGWKDSSVYVERNAEAIERRLNEDSYVFESPEVGRTHVTTETIRRWFKAAARRAGVSIQGDTPTPRDARKYFQNVSEDSNILVAPQTAAVFYNSGENNE